MTNHVDRWGASLPPRLTPFLWAAGLAAMVLAFAWVEGRALDTEVLRRVLYAAAATLLWHDLIAIARARPGARSLRDPQRWYLAYAMGGFWGTLMLIVAWEPGTPVWTQVLTWATAGAFFGGIMAATEAGPAQNTDADLYDLTPLDTPGMWARRFILGWPLVALAVLGGLAAYPPDDGWGAGYFLFQVVFLMTLVGPTPKGGFTWANVLILPRPLGLVLLLIGLLAI